MGMWEPCPAGSWGSWPLGLQLPHHAEHLGLLMFCPVGRRPTLSAGHSMSWNHGVTTGKLLNLPEPRLPHLLNGANPNYTPWRAQITGDCSVEIIW